MTEDLEGGLYRDEMSKLRKSFDNYEFWTDLGDKKELLGETNPNHLLLKYLTINYIHERDGSIMRETVLFSRDEFKENLQKNAPRLLEKRGGDLLRLYADLLDIELQRIDLENLHKDCLGIYRQLKIQVPRAEILKYTQVDKEQIIFTDLKRIGELADLGKKERQELREQSDSAEEIYLQLFYVIGNAVLRLENSKMRGKVKLPYSGDI